MNHEIASEKRAFRRSLNDLRGRDLLNLLLEQELSLILHPENAMVAYKRKVCFETAEWRLRETENRDEKVGQRVSNLRSRIKMALKKKLVPANETLTVMKRNMSRIENSISMHRAQAYERGRLEGLKEKQL